MPEISLAEQVKEEKLVRPFGTFNGKGYEAEHIASILPKHDVFVEAFSGSAAVTFAKKPSKKEIIAESDEFLFGIWNTIKNLKASDFKKLRGFKSSPDKEYFEKIKTLESAPDGKIKELHWWLYLKHYSLLCSAPNRDAKFFYNKDMKETVEAMPVISARLDDVIIESKTLKELIEAYDSEKTVFYVHSNSGDQIKSFAESLRKIKGKYILTCDNVISANFEDFPAIPKTRPVDNDFIESQRQWLSQFVESNGDNEELTSALAEVIMIARSYPGKSQEELGVDMGRIIELAKVALSGVNTEAVHLDKKKKRKKRTSIEWAEDAAKFVTSSKYTDNWQNLKERQKFDNWFGAIFAYILDTDSEPEDFVEASKWFIEHGMRYGINACEQIIDIRKIIKKTLGESATLEEITKAEKCVEDKIPKLIDEGEPRDRAIAIAFSLCGASRKEK